MAQGLRRQSFLVSAYRAWLGLLACACAVALSSCAPPSQTTAASEPKEFSSAPDLRINSSMHTAEISDGATGNHATMLVTASKDKTARVWSLADGHLISIFRPPSDEGWVGQLYTAAMMPDRPIAAVAGWTPANTWDHNWRIYLFNATTGALVGRLGTGSGVPILGLAASPDGRYLAAALSTNVNGIGQGIMLWRTDTWDLVASTGPTMGATYHLAFDRADRIVASSEGGWVSLYDARLHMVARVQPPGGSSGYQVAFSPDGSKVALGENTVLRVAILSGTTLAQEYTVTAPRNWTNGNTITDYSTVAWSDDGETVYAAGDTLDGASHPIIRAWGNAGRAHWRDIAAKGLPTNVQRIMALPSGGVAFVTGYPSFGVAGSRHDFLVLSELTHFSYHPGNFLLSPDGMKVAFSTTDHPGALQIFSVPDRQIRPFFGVPPDFSASMVTPQAAGISDANTDHPRLNGTPLHVRNDGSAVSAVARADDRVFLATEDSVYGFTGKGDLGWSVGAPGVAASIAVSADGEVVVVAYSDGSLRWYRADTGRLFLSAFVNQDSSRWILWTPAGYYDASPGGDDLIAWAVNLGEAQPSVVYPASRFRSQFFRPNIISTVASSHDERNAAANIAEILPPIVTIVSPGRGEASGITPIALHYTVRSPSGLAVIRLLVKYDGRPDPSSAPAGGQQALPSAGMTAEVSGEITVTPPAGTQKISLFAQTTQNTSEPAYLELQSGSPTEARKPKLYVLAVGINSYAEPALQLQYSAKDARDFAQVLRDHQTMYSASEIRVLTDQQATRSAVIEGLNWLRMSASPGDVAILFLSGHGAAGAQGNYYYLTQDYAPSHLAETSVSNTDIVNAIAQVRGKIVVFLDTCQAGAALSPRADGLLNELKSSETGAVVFASSTGEQLSTESSLYGNGVFTRAVVEGLEGQADYEHLGYVTISELNVYVSLHVQQMTKQTQTPGIAIPTTLEDFAIASR